MKQTWQDYSSRLRAWGYTDEQLEPIKEMRENLEHVPFDQYQELVKLGIIKRTQKLKKIRNLFTDGENIFYTNHYHKSVNKCGYFKNEEDGQ